jgi:hypothetical protein
MGATRREFLGSSLRAGIALPVRHLLPQLPSLDWRPAPGGLPLRRRFPDLRRRFVFEYYPWYATRPVRHWDQWNRVPPADLAANYVPRLGAYDSADPAVLEQHARWIAESGAGAINVSWWGRGSFEDRAVPLLMDVMRDHDLEVTFHLEPYAADHGARYADDVLYLLREYGEKRSWDALLLLRGAAGPSPVFKGFRTIVPAETNDCHGVTRRVADYTSDDEWRRQLDSLHTALGGQFPGAVFLADTLDVLRARSAGFDGIAIYDNFVTPDSYPLHAAEASALGLLFSFNVNPGYDAIVPRRIETGSCSTQLPFAPPATPPIAWERAEERERASTLSAARIRASFDATSTVQADPALANGRRGFFLTYLNSFNEWHEGHAFEPMRDGDQLSPAERVAGYHNPAQGDYRLDTLNELLSRALSAPAPQDPHSGVEPDSAVKESRIAGV